MLIHAIYLSDSLLTFCGLRREKAGISAVLGGPHENRINREKCISAL